MEEKSTFWPSAMTYGLYLGIALVLYNVILYIFGQHLNPSLGWITYVIITAGIFCTQQNYRNRELSGQIKYSTALGFGVCVMLFAGIIQTLYTIILYKYIDPSVMEQIRVMQEEAMLKQGLPEERIEMATSMMAKFQSPLILAVSSLITFVLIGLVISLITSVFVRRNKTKDGFEQAMEEIREEPAEHTRQ